MAKLLLVVGDKEKIASNVIEHASAASALTAACFALGQQLYERNKKNDGDADAAEPPISINTTIDPPPSSASSASPASPSSKSHQPIIAPDSPVESRFVGSSVFGPDMIGMPEAWFNFEQPHQDWGIFPRLAYDIITTEQRRGKGVWEISLKYFQNVVDRILDLLTGDGEDDEDDEGDDKQQQHGRSSHKLKYTKSKHEGLVDGVEDRHINEGFHVDSHGFVDITWCRRHIIKSWTELTKTFKKANAKKAIAPTQYNPASTRGHCILVFEAKMPHPTLQGVSRTGRLYVCDLAGAEPAANVHCAKYSLCFDKLYNKPQNQSGIKNNHNHGKHKTHWIIFIQLVNHQSRPHCPPCYKE